jgi:hypothetical protein
MMKIHEYCKADVWTLLKANTLYLVNLTKIYEELVGVKEYKI